MKRAQSHLTRTADAAAELGLVISAPKTEFMTIHCHPQPPLQVYGTPINHVTDFKYLGYTMASSDSDVRRRTAFWKLERLWKSPSIPISTKVTFFNITCITVLLHGCESWVIPKDMENRINSFGTSRYRMMIGHALRLPENEPVTDFVMYVPLHGRKKPGRQRPLFTNYIHCLLGILIIC